MPRLHDPAALEAVDVHSRQGERSSGGGATEERAEMLKALAEQGWRVDHEDHEGIWWSVAIARP